jgi:hypothetical protein
VSDSGTTVDQLGAMFPGITDDNWAYALSYQSLIEKFCSSIEVDVSDDDYQGSSFLLLRDNEGRPGFLIYGWGSCSGCDAMQACSSASDVASLYDELRNSVQWFADDDAARAWFAAHDWAGEFSWHEDAIGEFITEINNRYGLSIATPKDSR